MAFQFNRTDRELLALVAEYRILGVRHLAILQRRNEAALRRRLRDLRDEGLLDMDRQSLGRSRGRPERLVSLSPEGVDLLRAEEVLDARIAGDRVTAGSIGCLEHHLVTNEFRVQLDQMQRIVPEIDTEFLSPLSPFLQRDQDDAPLVYEKIALEDPSAKAVQFLPDGVFRMTDTEMGMTLLFFLEVDMGTETLASPRRLHSDVRQKIVNYQTLMASKRYLRYEGIWGCRLGGFRLLFLAHTPVRMAAICRLVFEMQPSDFVWTTDRAAMLSQGLWATIWARGGQADRAAESILDRRAPHPAPTPSSIH